MALARVLVVDDDWRFIHQMHLALKRCADLRVARDEAAALTALHDWAPDLVVLDLLLQDTDGFALLDRFTSPALGHRPVVLCATDGIGAGTRLAPCMDWPVGTLDRAASPIELRATILRAMSPHETAPLVGSGR